VLCIHHTQGLNLDLINKNDHVIVVASSHVSASGGVLSGIYSVKNLLEATN
jgi:hypothetical protein